MTAPGPSLGTSHSSHTSSTSPGYLIKLCRKALIDALKLGPSFIGAEDCGGEDGHFRGIIRESNVNVTLWHELIECS